MKKILLTATVQSHIAQFHKPLIELLKENGYEVHVAARNNLAEKNGLFLSEPDKIYDVPFERSPFDKKNFIAYSKLKNILKENSYDIVHCNTPVGGVLTRIAANKYRSKGLKVFYTAHGFHFYKGAPIKNWLFFYPIEKFMSKFTDKLITITQEDYSLAKEKFNTKVERIHGVGVDSKRYQPIDDDKKNRLRLSMGYSKEDYILLCIGELNKNKNQKTIIQSMPEVIKEHNNVKLLLAGNGPLDSELKKLVKKLNIDNYVEFLGYRTDLEKYISISDLIVSASKREGLGLNIIEGMISQKPVIASFNRGHNELIKNEITGTLVEFNDSKSFSSKILNYIENPVLAKKIAKNGYYSVKKYTINNVIEELKAIYQL